MEIEAMIAHRRHPPTKAALTRWVRRYLGLDPSCFRIVEAPRPEDGRPGTMTAVITLRPGGPLTLTDPPA